MENQKTEETDKPALKCLLESSKVSLIFDNKVSYSRLNKDNFCINIHYDNSYYVAFRNALSSTYRYVIEYCDEWNNYIMKSINNKILLQVINSSKYGRKNLKTCMLIADQALTLILINRKEYENNLYPISSNVYIYKDIPFNKFRSQNIFLDLEANAIVNYKKLSTYINSEYNRKRELEEDNACGVPGTHNSPGLHNAPGLPCIPGISHTPNALCTKCNKCAKGSKASSKAIKITVVGGSWKKVNK